MKFLVIRFKEIGDAILSLPVCTSLKKSFPGAQVDYLVYEHVAPLFEGHPDVDHVLTITRSERDHPLQYLKKMLWLRRQRYDAVFDLITLPASAAITYLSGAKRRVGFDHKKNRSFLYETRVPHPVTGNSITAKLALLEGFGGKLVLDASFPRLSLREEELRAMDRRIAAAGIDRARPVFAFAVYSRDDFKRWPPEYFVEVIERCLERYGAQAVMIWGPGEGDYVRAVAACVRQMASVFTVIETRDLRELAALLAHCDLFIGNDGGPRHVAEGVGLPTLSIYSPVFEKGGWLPTPGPRHRGLDVTDVLGISREEHKARVPEFRERLWEYYRRITPEMALREIEQLVRQLSRSMNCRGGLRG